MESFSISATVVHWLKLFYLQQDNTRPGSTTYSMYKVTVNSCYSILTWLYLVFNDPDFYQKGRNLDFHTFWLNRLGTYYNKLLFVSQKTTLNLVKSTESPIDLPSEDRLLKHSCWFELPFKHSWTWYDGNSEKWEQHSMQSTTYRKNRKQPWVSQESVWFKGITFRIVLVNHSMTSPNPLALASEKTCTVSNQLNAQRLLQLSLWVNTKN